MKIRPQAKITVSVVFALLCLLYPALMFGFEVEIDVAPNVLNLASASTVVTVHTDLPYGDVDVYSVFLNGVLIESWKADARGYFVAKFSSDEIKTLDGLKIDDYNSFKLIGSAKNDSGEYEAFQGEQEILVIDVSAKGK